LISHGAGSVGVGIYGQSRRLILGRHIWVRHFLSSLLAYGAADAQDPAPTQAALAVNLKGEAGRRSLRFHRHQ
jgi:hypothetical protein